MKRTIRIAVAVVSALALQGATLAFCADWIKQIHPYVTVKGEYSDNLDLHNDNTRKDFITTATPGVRFSNMTDQSGIALNAAANFVFYNEYSGQNYIGGLVHLDAKYKTSSRLNFYFRNAYVRSDSPREQEVYSEISENLYYLSTEVERRVYWRNVAQPTIEYQFGPDDRVGVTYRNNIYNTLSPESENSMENTVTPFFTYWFNHRNGIDLRYSYTHGDFENSNDLQSHKASASFRHRFTPKATAFVIGSYVHQDFFENNWQNYDIYDAAVGLSYTFSPTFYASGQVGYYWLDTRSGVNSNGVTFRGDISYLESRTTYRMSIQGGYTEDYFTSQNLGFRKYYRATGTINHQLFRRFSIGCLGSAERVEPNDEIIETIWGAGANVAFMPFSWMRLSAEYRYNQKFSDIETHKYTENRGMVYLTLTY